MGDEGIREASSPRSVNRRRIDYHVHTRWSYDSSTTPESLLERSIAAGLTHVCITDHDTIEGALAVQQMTPPGLEVVVGCEFSTDDGTQVIGLNLPEMIRERDPLLLMARIRETGGLVLLPHPFRRGSGVFRPELRRSPEFVQSVLEAADMVECFDGRDTFDNNRRSLQLMADRRVPSVAGSDAHTAEEVGSVFVEYADNDGGHGRSGRAIYYADRPRRSENAAKRAVMEFYHRHEGQWPNVVTRAYRTARGRGRDRPPQGLGSPRLQHQLPAIGEYVDGP
jgi:predicted metal-dependent phosphoesterase TrpH